MYRRLIVVLSGLLAVCVLTPVSQAIEFKDKKTGKAEEVLFTVGPEIGYFKYKEPDVMDEKGFQYGFFAKADYLYAQTFLMEAFLSYVWGDISYDGSYSDQAGSHSLSGNTPNTIFNMRVLAGYRITDLDPKKTAKSKWILTPYIGFGYRHLFNDLFSGDTGVAYTGYKRYQSYWYIPVGIQPETTLANKWLFQGRLEYDLFLKGRNESLDREFTQDSGYGIRASGAWTSPDFRKTGMKLNFTVEPYVEYWSIKESDAVENMHEPDNTFAMVGVRGGVIF